MERSKIRDVVIRQFRANVYMPEGVELDTSRGMLELGASSLDAVEIAYASMRELKIELPKAEIAKLRSIDDLVDVLHGKASGSAG